MMFLKFTVFWVILLKRSQHYNHSRDIVETNNLSHKINVSRLLYEEKIISVSVVL